MTVYMILTKFSRMEFYGSLVVGMLFVLQSLTTGVEGALGYLLSVLR